MYTLDIRDPIDQQLKDHIATIRRLSEMETPAKLVWDEVGLYLREAAIYLDTFLLPKIESKTPHVDLRGTAPPKVAEFVGATTPEVDLTFTPREATSFMGLPTQIEKSNGGQR